MVAQGRLEEAEALSLEVEGIAAEDDVDAQTLWRLARAKVLARRGEFEQAEALARDAVRLLEPTDYVVNQIDGLACLASVLLLAGNEAESRSLLARARALATAKGSPVMLERLGQLEIELAQRSLATADPT
jgi:ATP/maltotriose-dependent transcriptional regulator MalT